MTVDCAHCDTTLLQHMYVVSYFSPTAPLRFVSQSPSYNVPQLPLSIVHPPSNYVIPLPRSITFTFLDEMYDMVLPLNKYPHLSTPTSHVLNLSFVCHRKIYLRWTNNLQLPSTTFTHQNIYIHNRYINIAFWVWICLDLTITFSSSVESLQAKSLHWLTLGSKYDTIAFTKLKISLTLTADLVSCWCSLMIQNVMKILN